MSDDFEDMIDDMPPENTGAPPVGAVHKFTLEDFYAVAPEHKCLHRATRKFWLNAAVDARVAWVPRLDASGQPVLHKKTGEVLLDPPSSWLARNRSVEGLTWLPGADEVIRNKVAFDCGFVPKQGAAIYNIYTPPTEIPGDAAGSSMCAVSSPMRPSIFSVGWRTGSSGRGSSQTSAFC
jgi:hypothetical protein